MLFNIQGGSIVNSLVIDSGSHEIKLGWCGEDKPSLSLPSVNNI